ncbi:MAG: RNA-binding transcriptional accessory protein [Proteobacteria bacterium]|nr:RNA-binding transcriptional accessory protein [Pseudomonadota bacterium]MBU1388198.1 RNA-binding transcriptional accessory protein [Pseudomonadota bacterium]MBU1543010.1 RNA-binding transcriptional accessory protein [Pseudomonadota bacterium]MBU2431754.1 RNA-binding transcriptional accessory protein [Pseudomonadota bacterium]MBU2480497.1 RNA-binding transcriptional accessory protein [Pseudomonadota bacterium]
MKLYDIISTELNVAASRVAAVAGLFNEGATIPFIARYRKEVTGSMDEVMITSIRDRIEALVALDKRKEAIISSLEERDLLTPQLQTDIDGADSMTRLEDLYEKYRPKKRTRAQAAKEKGLEPLADFLLKQISADPMAEAEKYISEKLAVESKEDALSGARDIIAEMINEDVQIRETTRKLFMQQAQMVSGVKKGKEDAAVKFKDYFDWSENAFNAPSHRIHAMLRGQNEGLLTVHVLPDEEKAIEQIEKQVVKNNTPCAIQVKEAVKDSYKRLLSKSIEKECIGELKKKADETAIAVFANNLSSLLLSSPLGQKAILAIDPGFRTGCKVVCLDAQGKLLDHDVIFPLQGDGNTAAKKISGLVKKYAIQAIAVGNGTAGRETEGFIRKMGLDKIMDKNIDVIMVDESGASIYSASQIARQEFPDHDITVRGAVSIGRRLMDPLAELVKLDPRSIGVGQYQHDVDSKSLNTALDDVVVSCVNKVGVEANTASRQLLSRVAGLNDTIAANMVKFREENGPFKSRKDFLKVPRLGPKAFEQAAGFLRIHGAANPLDASGVHPESYDIVTRMAKDLGVAVKDLVKNTERINALDLKRYMTPTIGMPTLKDIAKELANPGRDPRKAFVSFSFDDTIHEIKDLVPGMKVPGIVTNVTAFGAFVDIGVHQDGLLHISQMADRFVKEPGEIVTVRDAVMVTILEVDVKRNRISLSLKKGQ